MLRRRSGVGTYLRHREWEEGGAQQQVFAPWPTNRLIWIWLWDNYVGDHVSLISCNAIICWTNFHFLKWFCYWCENHAAKHLVGINNLNVCNNHLGFIFINIFIKLQLYYQASRGSSLTAHSACPALYAILCPYFKNVYSITVT